MLDPVTALGLVSSIVQLVDFGSKLLIAGYGAYKGNDNATEAEIVIEEVYSDLQKLAGQFARSSFNAGHRPSEDELALQYLSVRCQGFTKQLIELLGGTYVHAQTPS